MTQTENTAGQLPTGEQIYDSLMSQINPELLMANLEKLDEPYPNETPEAHQKRYKKYQADFAKYDQAFEEWSEKVESDARVMTRDARVAAERQSLQEEAPVLSSLESQLAA